LYQTEWTNATFLEQEIERVQMNYVACTKNIPFSLDQKVELKQLDSI